MRCSLLSKVIHQLESNRITEKRESKHSIKESQRSSLCFTSRQSHAFPQLASHGVRCFKEPSNGDTGNDCQQRGGERQFGNVIDTHRQCNGIAHGGQDIIGTRYHQQGPKANPRGERVGVPHVCRDFPKESCDRKHGTKGTLGWR